MRYFIDAEFNGFGGGLVAFAAVPEDRGAVPFYEAVVFTDPTPWIAANVLPVLATEPLPLAEVARRFADYLRGDPQPVLIADWPEDISHAARLLHDGRGHRLIGAPVRFELMAPSDFASHALSAVPHNAYHDACALRDWALARDPISR